MKKISILLVVIALWLPVAAAAQDAAVEERLNRITGQMEQLEAARVKLEKELGELRREVSSLREQAAKPAGNFAGQDELKKLAEKLQEVDQKRVADNERILKTIENLAKAGARTEKPPVRTESAPPGGRSDKWFEYVIQEGDTLSAISQAYRLKGIKVTPDEILKANPGTKATTLQVGQKIWIPAP